MGKEFIVNTYEDMCNLMCDNYIPKRLCDTCVFKSKYEYEKPCIVYTPDCKLYKREENVRDN